MLKFGWTFVFRILSFEDFILPEILLQVKFKVIRNKSVAVWTEHGLVFIKEEPETLRQFPDLLFPSFSLEFHFAAQRNPEAGVDLLRVGWSPEPSRVVLYLYTLFPFAVHSPCLCAVLEICSKTSQLPSQQREMQWLSITYPWLLLISVCTLNCASLVKLPCCFNPLFFTVWLSLRTCLKASPL